MVPPRQRHPVPRGSRNGPPAEPAARAVRQLARRMILQQTFGGSAGDEALAIEALRLHEAEVRRAIAPERLLAFDVAEGWAPLCRFLVPIPRRHSPAPRDRADHGPAPAPGAAARLPAAAVG
ncbi:MAG: sulfotransferase [Geminicoccaceae bacterium]